MPLSENRITKALIRLGGCPGWSAPVVLANPQRQVFLRRGPFVINWHVKTVHAIHFVYTDNSCKQISADQTAHFWVTTAIHATFKVWDSS